MVFVTVEGNVMQSPYQTPPSASGSQRNFLPGPGEGLPLHTVALHFEGVIRIEGQLLRCVSTPDGYSSDVDSSSATVKRIPKKRLHIVLDAKPAIGTAYSMAADP